MGGQIFTDLDALKKEDIFFKFMDKRWAIHPMSAINYMVFINAWASVQELLNKKDIEKNEVLSAYTELLKSVCHEWTEKQTKELNQSQAGALLQLVLDCVQGRVQGESSKEKKKTTWSRLAFLA